MYTGTIVFSATDRKACQAHKSEETKGEQIPQKTQTPPNQTMNNLSYLAQKCNVNNNNITCRKCKKNLLLVDSIGFKHRGVFLLLLSILFYHI